MYFQLRYITAGFDFGDKQISVSDPNKNIEFLLRKRMPEDATVPPLKTDDGFVIVTCQRPMTERLQQEAVSSGRLSIKKGAVAFVQREMLNHVLRLMRLIRWRANSYVGTNPTRSGIQGGFRWSLDGTDWKTVADNISMTLSVHVHSVWTNEAEQFLGIETLGELDEPLGHELLREAWTNRDANPRSSIVLAVAAAEVGFKQFASNAFPDTSWILESLPSPPLVKMLTELFPWAKLNVQINGKALTPPVSVTNTLMKAVSLRNKIVHGQAENLNGRTVTSMLIAVRDLLYFLDAAQGQQWAIYLLSAHARKDFPQITSWPLQMTPLI